MSSATGNLIFTISLLSWKAEWFKRWNVGYSRPLVKSCCCISTFPLFAHFFVFCVWVRVCRLCVFVFFGIFAEIWDISIFCYKRALDIKDTRNLDNFSVVLSARSRFWVRMVPFRNFYTSLFFIDMLLIFDARNIFQKGLSVCVSVYLCVTLPLQIYKMQKKY